MYNCRKNHESILNDDKPIEREHKEKSCHTTFKSVSSHDRYKKTSVPFDLSSFIKNSLSS